MFAAQVLSGVLIALPQTRAHAKGDLLQVLVVLGLESLLGRLGVWGGVDHWMCLPGRWLRGPNSG